MEVEGMEARTEREGVILGTKRGRKEGRMNKQLQMIETHKQLIPDGIKLLFHWLPTMAVLTEFKKL